MQTQTLTSSSAVQSRCLPICRSRDSGRRGRTSSKPTWWTRTTKFDDDFTVAKPLQNNYFQKLGGNAQECSRSGCCVHPCIWGSASCALPLHLCRPKQVMHCS